jgi:hypothetical protein
MEEFVHRTRMLYFYLRSTGGITLELRSTGGITLEQKKWSSLKLKLAFLLCSLILCINFNLKFMNENKMQDVWT